MSKENQWIVGINAVAAAVEHDAGNVREVLLEAGAKNPRIAEIETSARRKDIDVRRVAQNALDGVAGGLRRQGAVARYAAAKTWNEDALRSEEHTSELQSLMRISYAVFCLKQKNIQGLTQQAKHSTARQRKQH